MIPKHNARNPRTESKQPPLTSMNHSRFGLWVLLKCAMANIIDNADDGQRIELVCIIAYIRLEALSQGVSSEETFGEG